MKVVVTLCTRGRGEMLGECLSSLVNQKLPPDVSLALIVVENDVKAHCRKSVKALARAHRALQIRYVHEPRLGIPIARNRALDLALEHGPDWIGFIDDDEVASPAWISDFVKAAKAVPCDVLQGPVEYRYPSSTPDWMPLPIRKHQPTGRLLRTAATSNTFMRARIAHPDGFGLRFNEAMRFTGGSDNEYFYRAADLGARVCWMDDAVVYETVPEVRTTLQWQLERSRRVAANSTFIERSRRGLFATLAKQGPKYAGRMLYGAVLAPAAAAISLIAEQTGKRMLVKALRNVWSGLGGLGAFIGFQPQPYRTVGSAAMFRIPALTSNTAN